LAPLEGLRTTETFVMPFVIKPTTSWILPETSEPEPAEANPIDDDEDLPFSSNGAAHATAIPPAKRRRGRPRRIAA